MGSKTGDQSQIRIVYIRLSYVYDRAQLIAKTNGCREHGMILNELPHNANRNHEDLAVTAINFTDAFESVPQELVMSVLRPRRFPE
jgi:hypothetical protein